jgi:sigma-B regulation protein RsbU (phosphoserine phosphatase)
MSPKNPFSSMFGGGSGGGAEEALREEVRHLQQSVETLSILNDLTLAMIQATDPEKAVEKLVDRSMRAVNAEHATVKLLRQEKTDSLQTQVDVAVSSAEHMSLGNDGLLLGWMMLNNKPLILNDPQNDDRFRGASWDKSIRSVMCLPLTLRSELKGILTIYNNRNETGFTEDDQQMLSIIGAQAAQVIGNAKLVKDVNRMEEQLNLAEQIQTTLFPTTPPRLEGYDIAGRSIPAQSVGGDYYDWIPIDDTRLAVCLGDVSGKGLPASLIMANAQATLRGQTLVEASVSERIGRSNKLLYNSTDDERFVTLWYGVLDAAANQITYASAGHEHPFLVSADGSVRRLQMGGLALGVFEEFTYGEEVVAMAPGDVLVVYSDGVPDATTEADVQFGDDAIEPLIVEHRAQSAGAIVETILSAVNTHAGDAPQFDDLTVVVVKRNA